MAHVALLHTLMYTVFRFRPRTCMNSPGMEWTQGALDLAVWNTDQETLTNTRLDMLEAGLGEVPEEGKGALPHLRHLVLHALVEEAQDVGADHKRLNVAPEPLCHSYRENHNCQVNTYN